MKTEAQKLADFRKRLADGKASWLIDIAAKRRVKLDLTREQQELLRKATRHVFPSVTVIFHSDVIEQPKHAALCCLEYPGPAKPEKSRVRKTPSQAARKSTRASR